MDIKKEYFSIIFVFIGLFLFANVIYSFLSDDLKVTGYTNIAGAKVEVHYSNLNKKDYCNGYFKDGSKELVVDNNTCVYDFNIENFGSVVATFDLGVSSHKRNDTVSMLPYIFENENYIYKVSLYDKDNKEIKDLNNIYLKGNNIIKGHVEVSSKCSYCGEDKITLKINAKQKAFGSISIN